MLNKFLSKKTAKKLTKYAAKKEAKVIVGSLVTIGTHKLIQKVARKYPGLSFLKTT
jgi:hypothetical protein